MLGMNIPALSILEPDFDPSGARVVTFWDQSLRLWTLYVENEAGDQVSPAEYEPNRTLMLETKERLIREYLS